MILLDYSQIALSNIFQFQDDLVKGRPSDEAVNIIRHSILTTIKSYKAKYSRQYGEVIIACDGKEYWRKQIFPHYKAGRSKSREKSNLDWALIFDTIDQIREDLIAHFPYKVIHVNHAEADDIVATIVKWTQNNDKIDRGMWDELQPVLIGSSDNDFKQLHKYSNVRQWSPIQKKFVTCDDPQRYLAEHIAKAGDDGIPNVLSPDHVFVTEGIRQGKMTQARLEEFATRGRDACRNDEERRNWDRNNALINLDMIPIEVTTAILDKYIGSKPNGDKMSVYKYLVDHRCRLLLDHVEEF